MTVIKTVSKKKKSSSPRKKPIINKHTTQPKDSKIYNYQYFDQYRDLFQGKMMPVSEKFIEKISNELLTWAKENKDALILRDFFTDRGMPYYTIRMWKEKHPGLKAAIQEAKLIIGSRREKGALTRKLDANTFFRTAVNYSPDFVETAHWVAELKKKAEETTDANVLKDIVTAMLQKFPNSDKVPPKDKK